MGPVHGSGASLGTLTVAVPRSSATGPRAPTTVAAAAALALPTGLAAGLYPARREPQPGLSRHCGAGINTAIPPVAQPGCGLAPEYPHERNQLWRTSKFSELRSG